MFGRQTFLITLLCALTMCEKFQRPANFEATEKYFWTKNLTSKPHLRRRRPQHCFTNRIMSIWTISRKTQSFSFGRLTKRARRHFRWGYISKWETSRYRVIWKEANSRVLKNIDEWAFCFDRTECCFSFLFFIDRCQSFHYIWRHVDVLLEYCLFKGHTSRIRLNY